MKKKGDVRAEERSQLAGERWFYEISFFSSLSRELRRSKILFMNEAIVSPFRTHTLSFTASRKNEKRAHISICSL